jgi:hypothetical protein
MAHPWGSRANTRQRQDLESHTAAPGTFPAQKGSIPVGLERNHVAKLNALKDVMLGVTRQLEPAWVGTRVTVPNWLQGCPCRKGQLGTARRGCHLPNPISAAAAASTICPFCPERPPQGTCSVLGQDSDDHLLRELLELLRESQGHLACMGHLKFTSLSPERDPECMKHFLPLL